jgi:hypothetical protein
MSWLRGVVTAGLVVACTSDEPIEGAAVVQASLGEGVLARVGPEQIAVSTVERISLAQSIDPRTARDHAVSDALLAVEARARSLDASLGFELRTALARATFDELVASARAEGPPTDSELSAWTERLYYTLDRPESHRTVHAVVRVPPEADASTWKAAEAIAEAVSRRVAPAVELALGSSPSGAGDQVDPVEQRFIELARDTPSEGLELVVQPLPPIAADGLTVQPEGRQPFDVAFVREATALERRGSLSKPFRSSFGWHVVLLLEKLPAVRVPLEERRRLLTPDVWDERIRARRAELVARLRREVPIEIERSADKLLEQATPR